jgi:hypothetical protein
MAKVSRENVAHVESHGAAEDRHQDLDGYTVNFVALGDEAMDLAPLLIGLPDDRCQCPHWGYVFEGRLVWTFADREEVCEAGDAFYAPPGHTPRADADSKFVIFSPTEELQVSEEAMQANMRRMQGAATP